MRLRRALWMAIVVGCGSLTGCASLFEQSSSTGAAILGSAAASTVTRNAAVATGIGLGVEALAAQGVRIVERRIHADEQAAIASVAGPLPTDSVATWEVHHSFALEPDEKGHVSVTRITTALGRTCKEIIFTVEVGDQQAPGAFLAEVCSVSTDESGALDLGLGGAVHRSVGRAAMTAIRWLVLLAVVAVVSGCASLADVAGGASAVASGAATGNPAVAIGVGGIVRGAVSAIEKAHSRSAAADTQVTIVEVASALDVGQQGPWREPHRFGSDATGRVEVTRVIYSPLAICKEIVFTLNDEETETGPYRAAICRTRQVWRWALAEPSTERWKSLR